MQRQLYNRSFQYIDSDELIQLKNNNIISAEVKPVTFLIIGIDSIKIPYYHRQQFVKQH